MSLPPLIEVVPLDGTPGAEITVPGSKSITNRALLLAALASGRTVLKGALWSEDTQVMVEALRTLGFEVALADEPLEPCNRTITVDGLAGKIPNGGTSAKPLELFVGNAGTAARFLAAFVCLGKGVYRLRGVPRMHERPQAELFSALRQLGYSVVSEKQDDKLPAIISSPGSVPPSSRGRFCSVSIDSSSQFASALLLCASSAGWTVEVVGWNPEETPYVTMTVELIKSFPMQGGEFRIEPDASSGSYFLAADALFNPPGASVADKISVVAWPKSRWQIDERFPKVLAECQDLQSGLARHHSKRKAAPSADTATGSATAASRAQISRARDLGDSIMMAIALAPFAVAPIRFIDLGRMRLQECERVVALRTELTKCGAKVVETGDTLEVFPSELHQAEIETYDDHRMAMCFAILGLKIPGIKIKNPACVKKTFPNFFQKLALPPPHGLGATVLETTGRTKIQDLFAD